MSNSNAPTHNVAYDPLPLTNDDYHNSLYNGPPSPEPGLSMFHTPQMDPGELGPDENAIPPVATQPRFLGAALYGPPSMRNSFASSNHTIPGAHSEYNSSLYTLNDPQGTGSNYRDDPSPDPVSSTTGRTLQEKRAAYAPRTKPTRKVMIAAIIVALALIIAAVIIPVYLLVIKPSHSNDIAKATTSSSAPIPSTSASSGGTTNVRVTGGNGSVITLENGTTFIYQNPFGGYWYWDENDPLNQDARAQSWSPALNETFNYGVDQVRGSVFRL
jgi:glucan 1,3-beta-glucosidase